jgi:hypothetical protein
MLAEKVVLWQTYYSKCNGLHIVHAVGGWLAGWLAGWLSWGGVGSIAGCVFCICCVHAMLLVAASYT